jgi:hypothetical protein
MSDTDLRALRLDVERLQRTLKQLNYDPSGWLTAPDHWGYASATSVSAPGDLTDTYGVGDRVRYQQNAETWQYGTISGVSYSTVTGYTTLGLRLEAGSTVANEVLNRCAYSKGATPQGYPVVTEWSLSANDFGVAYGSPTPGKILSNFYGPSTWLLDANSVESVGLARVYDGVKAAAAVEVDVWYAMESATSGAVSLLVHGLSLTDGANVAVDGTGAAVVSNVPGSAKYVKKATVSIAMAAAVGSLFRLTVTRYASDGADTAAGDLHLVAVTVMFT